MSDMLCYFIPTFDCPFSFFVGEVNGIGALRHYLSLRATEKHNWHTFKLWTARHKGHKFNKQMWPYKPF